MNITKFKTQEYIIPGDPLKIEHTYDRYILKRMYGELNGQWVELFKATDCPRHCITSDQTRHFCWAPDLVMHELPHSSCPYLLCGQVCDYMKRCYKDRMEKYGKWYEEHTKQFVQGYLAKENTVSWNTV